MRQQPQRNASYLAKALLNTEVTWPCDDPNDTDRMPVERSVRLNGISFAELPEVQFDGTEPDVKRYGRAGLGVRISSG
jgi:hypothetical protein